MCTFEKANITKAWMDMEQHIPKPIWQSKNIVKKNAVMKFCIEKNSYI